jgi:hypothetical protein
MDDRNIHIGAAYVTSMVRAIGAGVQDYAANFSIEDLGEIVRALQVAVDAIEGTIEAQRETRGGRG